MFPLIYPFLDMSIIQLKSESISYTEIDSTFFLKHCQAISKENRNRAQKRPFSMIFLIIRFLILGCGVLHYMGYYCFDLPYHCLPVLSISNDVGPLIRRSGTLTCDLIGQSVAHSH